MTAPSGTGATEERPIARDGGAADVGPATRYCTNHPDRETLLACGRCERPFCVQCLVQTPAGQRCYECAGMRRDYAQRAALRRLLQGAGIAALGGAITAVLGGMLYLIIGAVIAGSVAGQLLSPLITRHTRRTLLPLAILLLLVGAYAGHVLATALFAASRGAPIVTALVVLGLSAAFSLGFWLYAIVMAVVAGVRMR
jgi:hypothetical protein